MRTFVRRVADKTVNVVVPRAEAKARYCYWSGFCYCRGVSAYYKWCCNPGYCYCKDRNNSCSIQKPVVAA